MNTDLGSYLELEEVLRAACNDLVYLNTQVKAVKAGRKQTCASSTPAAPSTPGSEGSQPLMHRTHNPKVEKYNDNMTGRGKTEREFT